MACQNTTTFKQPGALAATAELGSVKRAAAALSVAPPAISTRPQALAENLGREVSAVTRQVAELSPVAARHRRFPIVLDGACLPHPPSAGDAFR